jgi:acetolactate synthase I/II/III large subunit
MSGPCGRIPMIHLFLRYLKRAGVRVVFGIPGGLLHPFFSAVERDLELRLIVPQHEEGAAFMADGYARTSGQLAVCAGTAGPGATNLITGVSVAHADGVPLLVVTGQAPSHTFGKGASQETAPEDIDIVGMYRPITRYSAMVMSPEHAAHHLRRALRLAFSGRGGPVHLNVPVNFWKCLVEDDGWDSPETFLVPPTGCDGRVLRRSVELLAGAKRPVFLAGSGVRNAKAEEALLQVAEVLPARVATTPRAKGVFPEDHPLSTGVFGFAGHDAARELMLGGGADVLLTVGASLNETTTLNWDPRLRPSRAHLQLDIDVDRIGRNYPVDLPLLGDARVILEDLAALLKERRAQGAGFASGWSMREPPSRGESRYRDGPLRKSRSLPLTPQRWRAELDELLPADAIVFSDIGGHMLFNIHHLCIRRGQRFVLNLGFGSMGHGTAAPVGAALAHPGRPVLAIIGDGCFTMNGMELRTAVEFELPVIWLVENNQMHGITWHGSRLVDGGQPMESIRFKHPLDVAGIARAMGAAVWIVDGPDQLRHALHEALRQRRPAVIDIRVDGSVAPPLGERATSIAGFRND